MAEWAWPAGQGSDPCRGPPCAGPQALCGHHRGHWVKSSNNWALFISQTSLSTGCGQQTLSRNSTGIGLHLK